METDEEILEQAKNYIIEIRKKKKKKIKIEGDLIIDSQGTWVDTRKYYNATKDMFDNSFYTFLNLTERINGFISYDIINKEIDDLIKTLKEKYLKLKKEYSSNVENNKKKKILSHAEILYMITFYIHKRLMNKTDGKRYTLPLRLIDFLHESKNLDAIFYPSEGYFLAGSAFTSKYDLECWNELEKLMTKIAIYIDDANSFAHKNYFETE